MPGNPVDSVDGERMRYLTDHQALTESMIGAIALCLSDPNRTKAECLREYEFWKQKLDLLHGRRIRILDAISPQP